MIKEILKKINVSKKTAIILVLVMIILIGVFLLAYSSKEKPSVPTQTKPETTTITPGPKITPPILHDHGAPTTPKELVLIKTEPSTSKQIPMAGTQNAIVLIFNTIVHVPSINLTASPNIDLTVKKHIDPYYYNAVIIQPGSPWEEKKYTITLSKGLTSFDGQVELERDIILDFTVVQYEFPNYDRPA